METQVFNDYVRYDEKTKVYSISIENVYIGFYTYQFIDESDTSITIKVDTSIITLWKKVKHIHIAIIA